MKIALLGYGKMGKEIEQIALERNHQIVLKISTENQSSLNPIKLKQADVAIEFSTPGTVVNSIYTCFEADIPIVVGATGWYDKFSEINTACLQQNRALFYATNFSLGVNLFFKMSEHIARMMSHFEEYEVSLQEIHHIRKLDKPSGTAITLAERILSNQKQKTKWSMESTDASFLYIDVLREDEVPGTHGVFYKSAIDEISLSHKAYNRKGFALGAVLAAEFIQNKRGVYTMDNLLDI